MVVLMGLTVIISAPILIVGGMIMALRQDVPLSGLLVVILPIMVVVHRAHARPRHPALPGDAGQDRPDQPGDARDAGRRSASSAPSCGRTTRSAASTTANLDLIDTALRVNRLFAITIPALMAIINLSTVAIIWFGAFRVDSGDMPIGNLTAFLQYIMQILFAVMMAVDHVRHGPPGGGLRATASRRSSTPSPSVRDPERAGAGRRRRAASVEFRDVEFRYPGAEDAGPARHLLRRPARARRRRSSAAPAAASRPSST